MPPLLALAQSIERSEVAKERPPRRAF